MSDADKNKASEPMTATNPAFTAVGESTDILKAADKACRSIIDAENAPSSTVVPVPTDANKTGHLVSLVNHKGKELSVSSTDNALSDEESPKLVASLKQPQDVAALPSEVSNPVSPSSVEDDASKSTIGGPDISVSQIEETTEKSVSAMNGEERGTLSACIPSDSAKTKKFTSSAQSDSLRRGKWMPEEEEYVTRVVTDFNSGFLRAPPGTTLRTYLSEKLNCDPMRITKKFTGELAIGKRVFHPVVRTSNNAAHIDKAQVGAFKSLFSLGGLRGNIPHSMILTNFT